MNLESLETRQLLAAAQDPAATHGVVVIDSALVASIPQEELAGSVVVAIDNSRDVVDQITTALNDLEDISLLRVISHGSDGRLWFGDQSIDSATLAARSVDVAGWSKSLTADADILLYGCSVASTLDGRLFVEQLGSLTQADIAASTDATGQGGDTDLEFQQGRVTATLLASTAGYERAGVSLDVNTSNSSITNWTNNGDGTITVTMKYDISGLFYYAGGSSPNGYVYMFLNGNQVARQAVTIDQTFTEYGSSGLGSVTRGSKNLLFTATLTLPQLPYSKDSDRRWVGDSTISVSPREGVPTTWSDPDPHVIRIEAPYYFGFERNYTVAAGQTLYTVANVFGTPTITQTATGLPSGVTISSNGTILGAPVSGSAGVYPVVVRATNGFAVTEYSITITVTNQAPSFASTNAAVISGATEGTPLTITHAALAAALDDADPNGDPLSFRIESVLGGTLTKNGSPVAAGTTSIAPGESVVWTPPAYVNGTRDAFTVKAYDGALYSATAKTVQVAVAAVNDPPTLTQFSGPVAAGNEDSAIAISFADLLAKGDEADIDSSVTAFVVKEVTTGTLRIGTSEATATPWNATTNKAITSSLNAYWTPDANANGPQSAFKAVARDDGNAESVTPVQAVVTVNPVNDTPTLTSIAIISGATGSDPFEIMYASLANASNAVDVDNDAIAFRIEAISSGSLEKWTGSAWAAVVPGTTLLSAGEKLRWNPLAGSSGLRDAFTVKAWDGQLASATAIQVRVDGDRWRVLPWTDAASSGIAPAYRYTHAYSFGATGSFAINGVTFTGIAGGNPAVAGRLATTGFATVATGDANNLTDASRSLANDAVASSATTPTVTLRGLTPGGRYVLSLYTVGLDSGSRLATLSSALGQITVDENAYGNNNGVRVDYTYLADASGSVTITLAVPGSSFNLYGLANREFGAAIRLDAPTSLTYAAAPKQFQASVLNYAAASNSPFVSSGVGHTVLLKADGTVAAYGYNDFGQANVPAGLNNVVAVSAGGYHTLALKSDGTVVAWGSNSSGQTSVPPGLTNVVAISAGKVHSLALKADGTVVAWGLNTSGQTSVPVGLTGIVAISAGADHSMALKADGTVVAWGYGWYNFFTPPAGLTDVVAISAGEFHSLALKSDGTVVAWGNNGSFQSQVPAGLKGVVAISAGTTNSAALKSDGTVVTWGDRDGYTLNSLPSGMPPGLSGVVAIDTGSYQTVALKSDGTVVTWGRTDPFGQRYLPTALGPIAAISTGNDHTLSLKTDGTVVAWGGNSYGQTNVPAGLSNVVAVQAGDQFSIALKSDRTVVSWGGAIGTFGTAVAMPVGLADVIQISASSDHVLALKADGTVVAWGDNYYGQSSVPAGLSGVVSVAAGGMGSLALKADGTVVYWGSPYAGRGLVPAGLSGVKAIAAGEFFSLALKTDGTVVAWGDSTYSSWWQVPAGLTGVVAIEAGLYHCLALKADGSVVAWGNSPDVPSTVNGVGVISLAAGYNNSIALKSDGTIVAWGNNHRGQNSPPAAATFPAVGLVDRLSSLTTPSFTYSYQGRGSTVYASSATPPTNAGDYTVTVSSTASGNAFSVSQNFTIARVTPSLTYSSRVPSIAYSMPLTSDQVGSTGAWAVVGNSYQAIPGSYVYSPDVGTVLPLGTQTLQVTFLPTDTVNFNPAVATATITVNNPSVVAASDISLTPNGSLAYSGTAKAFTASSTGISGFTYLYSGREGTAYGPSSTAPTLAGSYTVTATVNDPFAIGTKSVDFVIARAVPTISRNPTASTITFGQTLAATSLFGGSASVPGTFAFAAPSTGLNAGTSSQSVVFTPADTANYTTTTGTAVVTVNPLAIAAGAFTFSPPGTLVYNGSPKPSSATAVAGPGVTLSTMSYSYAGVSGTTYGPSATAPTNPGSYSVTATLVAANYVGSATQNFTITKATVAPSDITFSPPGSLTYSGTAKAFTASSAGISGFTYSYSGRDGTSYGPSSTAPTYAGSYTVTATVNDPLYTGTKSLDFTIAKIVSTITTNPLTHPVLTYGQTLAATNLFGGVASVPGTFAFASPSTVLNAGAYWQNVVFTPTDSVNYTTAIGSALVYVQPLTISGGAFTFTPPGSLVYDGSPKSYTATAAGPAGTLSAMSYSYAGISGTTYGPSATAPTNAGSYSVTATLTDGNFTGSATQTFTIAKVTPAVTWATPASITYYTALSATQLNATANAAGAFTYTPATGTVLGVGAHVLQAVFTPSDTTNYAAVTASVPLQVTSPQLPIALRASPNLTYDGTAKPYVVSQNAYLSAGRDHALALKADGTVVAWGRNNAGQATVPSGLTGVVQVVAGSDFSAAVKANGTVATWGSGTISTFTNLNLVTNAVAAAAGTAFVAVLRADGTVTSFGLVWNTQTLTVPPDLSGVTAVAAGDDHVLALKADGTVVAWGRNSNGQTTVPAELSNVVAVAASGTHSLALKADGTVVAWGNNSMGQCNVPAGLSGVVAITAGSTNSYALKADGTVVGWGYAYTNVVPANVSGLAALAAGSQHAFAIKPDGTVAAWGRILNSSGSDSIDAATLVPSPLSGVGNFSFSYSYAGRAGTTYPASSSAPTNAGNYTLTVSSTLANYSYGKTLDFTIAKATPTVTTLPQASLITEGQPLSASTLKDGVASVPGTFAFRAASFVPSAGVTTQEITFTPTDTTNFSTVISTVTVRSQGTNAATPDILSLPTAAPIAFGQRLQDSTLSGGAASVPGTFVFSSALTVPNPGTARQSVTFLPTDIVGYKSVTVFVPLTVTDGIISPLNISLIPPASLAYDGSPKQFRTALGSLLSASASGYVLAAKSDGTVGGYTWHPTIPPLTMPAGLTGVVAVSAGSGSYRALKSDGTVAEWGSTWAGSVPPGLNGVVAITSGTNHSLALKSNGTVVAWGANWYGQGNVPASLTNVVAIAASSNASFALKSNGTVVAWGSNENGQCDVPDGLSGVIAISAGANGTIAALKSDGTVVSWGRNVDFSGNVTGQATVPAGLTNVVAVAVGHWHTAALKADGTVVTWGQGTTLATLDTVNIAPYNLTGVVALTAEMNRTYALRSDGSVVWWGQAGNYGQHYVDGQPYLLPSGSPVTAPAITPLLAADSAGFAFSATYTGRDGTTYASSATPPTNIGDYSVTVTGTDPDFVATKTIDFSITKATPTITAVPTATGITHGQTLAASSLSGGSASVDGTFAFAAPTSVPNAGTNSQSVVFTPNETSIYAAVTLSVPVAVARVTPTLVTLPTATSVTFGQSLASAVLANGLATVPGAFSFTSSGTVPAAGSSSHGITFTPTDSVNYASFTASVNVFVTGGPPTITAPPTATSIRYGQNLAYSALSGGIASVPGTFAFADASLVPASGTTNQNVVFTPSDTANYSPVTLAVAVRVRSLDTADDAGTAGEATGLANGTAGLDAVGNVLDNDTTYDNSGLAVTGITGSRGAGTIGTPLAGTYGTLTILADGSYVYVVDNANAAMQALDSGATLVESFTYGVAGATDTASATLRITIYGGNDGPSLTTFPVAVTSVNEDTEAELTFAAIAAAGDEADVDGSVTAFVVKSVPSGTLRIGVSAGAATPWDAATNAVITSGLKGYWMPAANASGTIVALTVVARDDGGLESPLAVDVPVTVLGVNDQPTDITLSNTAVAEHSAVPTTVGTLSTTDVDAGDRFTYSLVSGAGDSDNAVFSIDGSGLKANASFNFEAKTSYSVRVRSTDANGLFTEKSFVISVTDVNETSLDIGLAGTTVAENAASGTLIGTLSTTDADAGDTFTYALVPSAGDTDNADFTIDGSTLKTSGAFDFETKSRYSVRVLSIDAGGLFTEKTFTILVTDVNETPSDIGLTSNTVAENAPSGTSVGTLSTTDVDAGDTFNYSLVSGTGDNDNASFTIDGSTLKTSATFDFETKSSYTVRVRSTDVNGLFTEKAFTILVSDVNDTPTDITLTGSTVAENAASGTTAGTLATTDVDTGDTFTYTLVAGTGDTDNAAFTIDGSTLKTAASFDFETRSSYTVRVRSTDANGLTTEKPFTISVTNVNEVPTDITLSGNTVAENATSGTTVGTLSTMDVDAGDTFTYALVAGSGGLDNAVFTIDGNTLKTAAVFDRETRGVFSVLIRSTDANGFYVENIFTIVVTNVNEAPTDTSLSGSTVAENAASGTAVGTLSTTDVDAGDTFTYSLVSGTGDTDNASFSIDGSTLKTTASFDFEAGGSYTVRVRSTDANGLSFEKPFTISVTNVNEAPTDITLSGSNVAENAAIGTSVGTLATTDVDAGDTFTYTLVAGTGDTDNAVFTIDGSTLKTAASFDFETRSSYTVRVRSTDANGLFTEKALTILVTDVNEIAIISLPDPFPNQVTEDAAVDGQGFLSASGAFVVSDPDAGESAFGTTVTAPAGQTNLGQLTVDAAGTYVYKVLNGANSVQALRAGATHTDTFVIRSIDGTTRNVSFQISGVADTLAGAVADGYLAGATLFADSNGNKVRDWIDAGGMNGIWDAGEGEAWTTTDASGNFSFDFGDPAATLVTIGGTDISTGMAFTGSLSAPAGSTIVNPLTTLVAATIEQSGLTAAAAKAAVGAALGLPATIDLTAYDPLAQIAGDATALEVQKAAASIANVIVVSTNNGIDTGAALENLAALITASPTATVDLQSSTVLTTVLTITVGSTTTPPPAALVSGLALVNTAVNEADSISAVAEIQEVIQEGTPFAAPAFTSAATASFATGIAGSFQFVATGYPAPTFSTTGTLPTGITLSAGGLLSGTPAAGTSGTYAFTVTATNGVNPDATQGFTLTVTQTDDVAVSVDANKVVLSLASTGVAISSLHTAYNARTHTLTITAFQAGTMVAGGPATPGVTVNSAAKTIVVNLGVMTGFAGISVVGNGGVDSVTIGGAGINLSAVTKGAASQSFSIDTMAGATDMVVIGKPITAKGSGSVSITTRATDASRGIRFASGVTTATGSQAYAGPATLLADTVLTAGNGAGIGFSGTVDGAKNLSLAAGGAITFAGAVGSTAALKGLAVSRAASVAVNGSFHLNGTGTAAGANGLTIGRGVNNFVFATLAGGSRTIHNFSGSGIRFAGGSTGSTITGIVSRGNGTGLSFAAGSYTGTRVQDNTFDANLRYGVLLDGATNLLIGGTSVNAGNRIINATAWRAYATGIQASGNSSGTLVQGNTISGNSGNGVVLVAAKGITIGGVATNAGNTIRNNLGFGLLASGASDGSLVQGNTFTGNRMGAVNVKAAKGLRLS